MKILKNNIIHNDGKRPILYDIYYKETDFPKPIVVFCHGYKGFKDWGAWELVAQSFAESDFFFLKFNFSHNGGTIENPIDFPDLVAFSENTYSKELEDLNRIITELKRYENQADTHSINLIGHSRGGGLILLGAELYPEVIKSVTWAGVSDFAIRFQEHTPAFTQWKETGITYVENARTQQHLPHKFSFYEDFNKNREAYSIERAVKNTHKPLLIIQGTHDHAVTMQEAKNLHKWATNSELYIVEGADHVFQTKHPWESKNLPEEMLKVVNKTISFLK